MPTHITVDVEIGCRCLLCKAEADLDRLKDAGAKLSRNVQIDGYKVYELEVPEQADACHCGCRRFVFRWQLT